MNRDRAIKWNRGAEGIILEDSEIIVWLGNNPNNVTQTTQKVYYPE